MDSCFPPLSALSLRDKGMNRENTARNSLPVTSKHRENVLQDLDIFYIRQIAHSLQEYELEQKIEVEVKMREGTSKLLAACRHPSQSLEAAKALLTSNERMTAYLAELQRRRKKKEIRSPQPGLPASQARMCLSELRLPLIWKDTDHFKNRGDHRRFAVFCLARCGTEIYDTVLLSPVDRSLTDLTFPDVIVFNHVPCDFSFRLEVYSHTLEEDLTMASTPKRLTKSLHSSFSKAIGRKLAASLKEELALDDIGPKFDLVASASLSLEDVHDCIRTHDLVLPVSDCSHGPPLFGHFCCRLAAQPNCMSQDVHSGPLILIRERNHCTSGSTETMASDGSSASIGSGVGEERVWAVLKAFHLNLYESRANCDAGDDPLLTSVVNKNSTISSDSNNCEIKIANTRGGEITLVRTLSQNDRREWLTQITSHINDHVRWQHAAERVMVMLSPSTSRNSTYGRKSRQGSLYDETPIFEDDALPRHPTVHEIFKIPQIPSTSTSATSSSSSSPSRQRSFSVGEHRRKKTTWSAENGHIPK